MRVAFLVYGVLYVVIEIVGYQLEQVSWPEITPLDVASAVADALLTVAVLVAVLVLSDVLGHRWHRSLQLKRLEQARLAAAEWADPGLIEVRSWRPEPLALPAAPPARPTAAGPRATSAYAPRAWPEEAPRDVPSRML